MRSQRWRLRAAVTGATVLALVAATGPTSSAAPPAVATGTDTATPTLPTTPTGAPSTGESPLPTSDALSTGGTRVTLVTGDVVSYTPGVNGAPPRVEVTSPRGGQFTQVQDGDHYYVYPGDARALVGAGKLDKSLFDVAYLARNGFGDDVATSLPLIVQYPTPAAGPAGSRLSPSDAKKRSAALATTLTNAADALPATTATRALPAARSAQVQVSKVDTATFWASVDAPTPTATTLDAGVAKIWLNHRAKALLDVSVPQIGAPEAWAAGYDGSGVKVAILDTGIDDTHPDLAGKVIASKNFVGGESAKDGHGHGTHVASTIVGSGAASGGRYKGVAPGAQLIIGKVLNDDGFGDDAGIIAGMQWAAEQGAKIISMSIGGNVTDGTDPLSQAVDELSAQYGTLFVVAAGNDGAAQSINAPGTADAALTVAAVDKQEQLASFSSRGPRNGDLGLKPDIAAPGVNITAAKADGTALGPVVDERYTTISGTSMATPHVSGAAAILAQEHPDWTGQKIKAVLTSTTRDDGFTPYEQGAGRVDVPRAITQQVYATGSISLGTIPYPQTAPVSRTLTYANDGDTPVTLALTTSLATRTGTAPAGMLGVSPATLTVPAHGTADTTVTLDVTKGPETIYGGAIRATNADGSVNVRTALGGYKQRRQSTVSVRVINRPDATNVVYSGFHLMRLDDDAESASNIVTGPAQSLTRTVDAGVYSVGTSVTWRDPDGEWNRALVTEPTVDATGDRGATVTFDLRRAVPETVRTPKASVPYRRVLGYEYAAAGTGRLYLDYLDLPYGATRVWSLPTGVATRGGFVGFSTFHNGADPITMTVRGAGRTSLHPLYQSVGRNEYAPRRAVTMLDGRSTAQVVAAGHGLPADFAGIDARGKIALLDLSDICPAEPVNAFGAPCSSEATDRVSNAKEAGAVAVLGYGTIGRQFLISMSAVGAYGSWPTYAIPTMSLTAEEGRMLAARLARGPVTVDVDATKYTPYLYPLAFVTYDRMPVGARTVRDRDLYRVDHRLHTDVPGGTGVLGHNAVLGRVAQGFVIPGYEVTRPAPFTVTTYTGPVGRDVAWMSSATDRTYNQNRTDLARTAGSRVQNWGEQPLVPSAYLGDPATAPYTVQYCFSCRSGNILSVQHLLTNDGTQAGSIAYNTVDGTPTTDLRLYRADGTELPKKEAMWLWLFTAFQSPYFDLPAQRGTYRMTEGWETPLVNQRYARTVQTERTFSSQRPDDGFTRGPEWKARLECSSWLLLHADPNGQPAALDQSPCRSTNELYLGYDFGLNLDNTLPAGTRQTVTVSGFRSPYENTQPRLATLTLSLSYDDGKTWQKVNTKPNRDGTHTATFTQPALDRTTGAVSVRAEATDTDGNTVKQTITRAYGLTAAPSHGSHGTGGTVMTAI